MKRSASSRAFRKAGSLRCVAPTRIRTPSGLWSGEVRQPCAFVAHLPAPSAPYRHADLLRERIDGRVGQ